MSKKPLQPVRPTGIEVVFFYPCPHCGRRVPLLAPTRAEMGQCDACSKHFPLAPVDEHAITFIKTITANGRAGIDPNFM